MKKTIAMSIGCLVLAGLSGCCNCITRTEGNGAPYACAPYPYYCTAETWPGVILDYGDHYCGTKVMLMRRMWLFCVVDEVFEVALDTVFLPVDLTSLYCFTNERRKEIAEARERRKKIAEEHERRKKYPDIEPRSISIVKVVAPPSVSMAHVLPAGNSANGANAAVPVKGVEP